MVVLYIILGYLFIGLVCTKLIWLNDLIWQLLFYVERKREDPDYEFKRYKRDNLDSSDFYMILLIWPIAILFASITLCVTIFYIIFTKLFKKIRVLHDRIIEWWLSDWFKL